MHRGSLSVLGLVYAPLSVALGTNKCVAVLNLIAHGGLVLNLVVIIDNSNGYYFILWLWRLQLRFAVSGRKRREA